MLYVITLSPQKVPKQIEILGVLESAAQLTDRFLQGFKGDFFSVANLKGCKENKESGHVSEINIVTTYKSLKHFHN